MSVADKLAISPKIMEVFHAFQVIFWTAMIPVALFSKLKSSVPFLVMISILALVFSELAAWQGSLAERRLDDSDDFGDDDG
jgi:hypothetical protein